jgi:hypothetical protein
MSKKRGKKHKKKRDKKIKTIIGIDEINNGYHAKSNTGSKYPYLIMAAYITHGITRANYGSCKYEHKGKLIKEDGDLGRALERGKDYIKRHPDFLYTIIPENSTKKTPTAILKGNAAALLVFEFFLRQNLKPEETVVIVDETDGIGNSEAMNYILDLWLDKAGLNLPCRYKSDIKVPDSVKLPYPYIYSLDKKPYRSKRRADDKVVAVRKADRISYYLAAIHYLGHKNKWPHRKKKISLNHLEERCLEVKEKFSEKERNLELQKYF